MKREPETPPPIPDYELLRPIGRGSYGDVWLARGVTGVWRAIKVVWRDRFEDAGPFEREFKGLKEFAEISLGESIQLALLHVGRDEAAGFFYYAMELADDAERGRAIEPVSYVPLTLAELRQRRGRLAAAECVRFGVELSRVLASLHRRGLVHRDIKPSNVILVGGAPKLADIGLVAPVTSARTFVGTEGYVPPEGPGAPSADVFALGKLLYELATGLDRQEFPQLPPALDRLPDHRALLALNEVILRACDPMAARRHADGAALLSELEALQSGRRVRRGVGWKFPLAAAAVALAAGVLWWQWRLAAGWPKPARPPPAAPLSEVEQTVAVLPFANLSGDAGQDYVSDGLTVGIIDELMHERALRVPGPISSFSFKGKKIPAPEIARALNVARLIEGSVQSEGGRVRIRVALTSAEDGFSEPIGVFDRELKDLFALQDDVARAVVAKLTRRPPAPAGRALTRDPTAYELYLRGRTLQTRSATNTPEAAKLFEQALQLDPAFALAWARLAETRIRVFNAEGDESPARLASSRAALDRALALQPDLPEALLVQARIQRALGADAAAVERAFARVEALQPAHPQLRFAQAWLALDTRPWPEAARLMREALSLDPQNGNQLVMSASTFYLPRGEFAEAHRFYLAAGTISGPLDPWFVMRARVRLAWRGDEAALRLVEREPKVTPGRDAVRAELLTRLGRVDEARAAVAAWESGGSPDERSRRQTQVSPYYLEALHTLGLADLARELAGTMRARAQGEIARGNRAPMQFFLLAQAERILGDRDAALAALAEWRRENAVRRRVVNVYPEAIQVHASLGLTDQVVTLLRAQFDAGVLRQGYAMRRDPMFAPVREDARFQALMAEAEAKARSQPDPVDP